MAAEVASPLFRYFHVNGDGTDIYAAFVQLTSSDITKVGLAPAGFSPTPLGEMEITVMRQQIFYANNLLYL